jgi:hypothetical protein
MDFNKLVGDSFSYAKEGLVGDWVKWILLIILALLPAIPIFGMVLVIILKPTLMIPAIILCIIFAVILTLPFMGYTLRIYRGDTPAPKVNELKNLFSDGFRLFIVSIIYSIPLIIVGIITFGTFLLTLLVAMSTETPSQIAGSLVGMVAGVLLEILIFIIVAIITGLLTATAYIRFARTNIIKEAFNFEAIFAHIGRMGWFNYIAALIIMGIIVGIIEIVFSVIPYIGSIILLILTPPITLFSARYLSLLYDCAGSE